MTKQDSRAAHHHVEIQVLAHGEGIRPLVQHAGLRAQPTTQYIHGLVAALHVRVEALVSLQRAQAGTTCHCRGGANLHDGQRDRRGADGRAQRRKDLRGLLGAPIMQYRSQNPDVAGLRPRQRLCAAKPLVRSLGAGKP